jgi:hypothetical protein
LNHEATKVGRLVLFEGIKSFPLKRKARAGGREKILCISLGFPLQREALVPYIKPMPPFDRSSVSRDEYYKGHHRFEHWYRDNTVYFITARVHNRICAFQSEAANSIFWDRFNHYTKEFGFVPWVTSLMDNHWHTEGYLPVGQNLGPMMQRIHGSVAKLVNDLLPNRITPFWGDGSGRQNYFDGCLCSERQGRKTFRYIRTQCRRHGICENPGDYPHTHVNIDIDRAIKRALELNAFMTGVPYKRYGDR